MRVLDVGSGAGDVTFLAAELVGDTGEVLGVDRASPAITAAKARAEERSIPNISFLEGDPGEMVFDQRFDAVIGRYVLAFQNDPSAMLQNLCAHLRPGGTILFHEADFSGLRSVPPATIYDRCCQWVIEAVRAGGVDTSMGVKMHSAFLAAGLPSPMMRLEALIGAGANSSECLLLIAGLVGTLRPEIERLGLATAAGWGSIPLCSD